MKKTYKLIILLIVIIFGIYLNLSYGRIYNLVTKENLKSPDKNIIYSVGKNANNNSSIYVALGDSLTAGVGVNNYEQSYPYLIAEKLSDKNNIILKDRSFPGFKTYNLENTLLSLAISDKPNIVTLLIGINDIRDNVSKEDFKINYEKILENLSQKTNAKIYVMNIPFVGSSNLILPPYNYYFNYKTIEFNKIIQELAKKYNAQYID